MARHEYVSGAAAQIESFVRHRTAADRCCASFEENLHLFDAHSAADFPGDPALTQRMVDSWFELRPTESLASRDTRCGPVAALVGFLRDRGETDVAAPELPRRGPSGYVPHPFTDEELAAFFRECDSWRPGPCVRRTAGVRNMHTFPVIFRLLWSSGIRTCEARLLRRDRVDLDEGVLEIREGKGRSERLVALHPSMNELMRRYDPLMEGLFPDREWFFPAEGGRPLTRTWLARWFRVLWSRVSDERATPYMLRHQYAVENINGLVSPGMRGLEDMEYLSKSMGHTSVEVTVGSYYHIVPAVSEALQADGGCGLDEMLPEVM